MVNNVHPILLGLGLVALYVGWFLFDSYLLQRFLNIPQFKTAAWRTLKLGLWTIAYLVVPMFICGIVMAGLVMYNPEFLVSTISMTRLCSFDGIVTVWRQGLVDQELVWAIIGLLMMVIGWVISYYLRCYVYRRRIDASVDRVMLKKAVLYIMILDLLVGKINSVLIQNFMR